MDAQCSARATRFTKSMWLASMRLPSPCPEGPRHFMIFCSRSGCRQIASKLRSPQGASTPRQQATSTLLPKPIISVIICSINAAKFAAVVANYRDRLIGQRHEIIGIHDARSLAEGYNRGAARAQGELLIFSHDDVEIVSSDLPGALARATATLDVFGVVGTSRVVSAYWPAAGHPYLHGWLTQPDPGSGKFYVGVFGVDGPISARLQGLDGMFFAAKRSVVDSVRFDETTFDGFHGYDMDFSFSAHLAGFRVGTTAEIALIHASGGKFGEAWSQYAERFSAKHAGRLGAGDASVKWSFARRPVESKAAIVREFPIDRLVAITRELRARALPPTAGATSA